MDIIWNLNTLTPGRSGVVTVGTFDGIHLGHQRIIERLKMMAKEKQALATLVTFEPHPQTVLKTKDRPELNLLTTIDEKIEVLSGLGLDRLVVMNFTLSFAEMDPEAYVKDILLSRLNMKGMIIGEDHSFGRNRSGNIEKLNKMADEHDFEVKALAPIRDADRVISSTRIRHLLREGEVKRASELLGRPYTISGQVVSGDGRGRELGYPTANLNPFSRYKLIPKLGIYASRVRIKNSIHDAVTYIGERPTFNLNAKVIEIHIPDFDGVLYDQHIELSLFHFIRDDAQFQTEKDLVSQIDRDIRQSQELLSQGTR